MIKYIIVGCIVIFTMGLSYLICQVKMNKKEDDLMGQRLTKFKFNKKDVQQLDIFRDNHKKTVFEYISQWFKGY